MTEVHCKFNLQDKITRTTTDNGSNFVKAFVQFAETPASLPALDVPPENPEQEAPALSQFVEENEEPNFHEVHNVILRPSTLPLHMRCAAHTFNLVATKDADNAMKDMYFESASNSAMTKTRKLWNAQSRSTVNADVIFEELKRRLVVPNATRWNSIYDSIVVLNKIISDEKNK
jgi:hypothetical protein